jgi:3-methyladenine DNA glycosylase AlkD
MATTEQVLGELSALGTAQNRKVYKRHGSGDNLFGVSYADLGKVVKRIKTDHDLAKGLWASGNHDARVLALMVADPARADEATIEAWVAEADNYVLADAVAGFVAKTPFARAKAEAWSRSQDEWVGTAGWDLVGSLGLGDRSLPDEYFKDYLGRIERDLHDSLNRVRYAMNTALIAIGMRSPELEQKALAVAARIGKVEVDHGETGCKTPDAATYIVRAKARKRK